MKSTFLANFEVGNVSSTLTNTTIWFVSALCFIVDIQTARTDDIFYQVY